MAFGNLRAQAWWRDGGHRNFHKSPAATIILERKWAQPNFLVSALGKPWSKCTRKSGQFCWRQHRTYVKVESWEQTRDTDYLRLGMWAGSSYKNTSKSPQTDTVRALKHSLSKKTKFRIHAMWQNKKHTQKHPLLSTCVQFLKTVHACWVASIMSNSFVTLWTVARQAPLSMGFSRQEYWSGLPFPTPGDLLDPGIKPASLVSPALTDRYFYHCITSA